MARSTGWVREHKIQAAAAAAGVLAAFAAVAAVVVQVGEEDGGGVGRSSDNEITGDGNNAVGDVEGDVTIYNAPPAPTPTVSVPGDAEFERLRGEEPPEGPGPYGFVVKDTGGVGLVVRDGFRSPGLDHRLPGQPLVPTGRTVYVDCQVTDGWDTQEGTSGGKVWYKVRWPDAETVGDSWVYSGWTVPVGHNGQVPVCTDAQRGGS